MPAGPCVWSICLDWNPSSLHLIEFECYIIKKMAWVILVWAETSKWKQTWETQTRSSRRHHSSFGDTPIGLIKMNGGLPGPYINSHVHMCHVDVQPNKNGLNIAVILLDFVPASGHQGWKQCHLEMPSTVMKSLYKKKGRRERCMS